ncbi:AI-2E family transporter [Nocardioides ferulae]|uniref:AI-2E family transporter n=1 Tax=Nocardioides ferulae TaxID=2340821 RepID=UPI001F0C8408|nr:AI-2E family transporter [Nocardioides ferulae]
MTEREGGQADDEAAGLPVPPPESEDERRRRVPRMGLRSRRDDDRHAQQPNAEDDDGLAERVTQQIAHQWALIRAERRAEQQPPQIVGGRSNFSRAQVPWGYDLAAAWAWRFLVICAAGYVILWLLARFAVITVPLAIALLIAALATPGVRGLRRIGVPQGLAAGLVVLTGLAMVGGLGTVVGQQIADQSSQLADQVVKGLGEIRTWLKEGPLNASDTQIQTYIERTQEAIGNWGQGGDAVNRVTDLGTALSHVLTGFFVVLFATYFFLADGRRIWAFFVRLAPRAARERIDSSGRVAWVSLTQFVRATVLVALVDAIGIAVWAAVLGLPLVLAIGLLVFLGAFVPLVGATVAGAVAVLVALVDQGPWTALLMLVGVIVVQQVEGHVLQPFLMGRFVSVHPLGVIVAIGCGVLVAGVTGALIAVPLVAAANAVVQHLAAETEPGDDPERELADELPPEQRTPVRDEGVGDDA